MFKYFRKCKTVKEGLWAEPIRPQCEPMSASSLADIGRYRQKGEGENTMFKYFRKCKTVKAAQAALPEGFALTFLKVQVKA